MSDLLKVNVNDHTERKNNLTYLSWAWAWAEVLKIDPAATWEAQEFYRAVEGSNMAMPTPCMHLPDGSAMVKVKVTIKGNTKASLLPVMDHRNKAIKNPDAFAINTAIMRCMTKAISMHGLGLYIYAGEDLPEGEEPEPKPASPIPASFRSSATMGELEMLPADQQEYIRDLAIEIIALVQANDARTAVLKIEAERMDDTQKMGLWSILDSKVRSAIKAAQKKMLEPA